MAQQGVFKKHPKLHPYKITSVHEMKEHVQYCRWFWDFLTANEEDIMDITCFSDEAWFHLSGYINSQNSHVWLAVNPHAIHGTPLNDQKVGVWCTISWSWVIGPTYFDNAIDSDHYHHMTLYPSIDQLNEDEITHAHFQQDSATVHTVQCIHGASVWFVQRLTNFREHLATKITLSYSPQFLFVGSNEKCCLWRQSS
jgi:hypothetical protein